MYIMYIMNIIFPSVRLIYVTMLRSSSATTVGGLYAQPPKGFRWERIKSQHRRASQNSGNLLKY